MMKHQTTEREVVLICCYYYYYTTLLYMGTSYKTLLHCHPLSTALLLLQTLNTTNTTNTFNKNTTTVLKAYTTVSFFVKHEQICGDNIFFSNIILKLYLWKTYANSKIRYCY